MTKEYTEEENRIWRASQPQKMVVVKVVIKSDKGNVLLAKPDYKKTWQLPGGGVEDGESPEDAVVRETLEELDLTISKEDLIIKGTIYKKDEEMLFVIYESTKVVSEHIELQVQENEITDFQFADINSVPSLISDYYSDFWKKNY
jgi:ADP-ribose pyrophosphatase YjhB (NUDIX family)